MHSTLFYQMPQIAKTGAPFDFFLLSDFPHLRKSYKFYVFLNVLNIDSSLKTKIHSVLEDAAATALWTYAPGAIDGTDFSLEKRRGNQPGKKLA